MLLLKGVCPALPFTQYGCSFGSGHAGPWPWPGPCSLFDVFHSRFALVTPVYLQS